MSNGRHRAPRTAGGAAPGSTWTSTGVPAGPTARISRPAWIGLAAAVMLALALWAVRHAASMIAVSTGHGARFAVVFTLAFGLLVWGTVLGYLERPKKVTRRQQAQLDRLHVAVLVPVYNEDPAALRAGLASLLTQTRRPDIIAVVDDGSTVDYDPIIAWLAGAAANHRVAWRWDRQDNAGKRHAQGLGVHLAPDADVYLTVDSDALLDRRALSEGLKPFADPRIQSVAGIVLALNNRTNLLTRLTDLWFVTGQLTDRSAMSTMGSVLVNSGPLALYRGDLVRDNLDGYLNETFAGRRVEFSDDSMLTIYALDRGKAVQQPTAISFTLMPETLDHHVRQYMRWMRGATIRSFWRFRHLPLTGYAYWGHLIAWVQMTLGAVVFIALFIVQPVVDPAAVPWFLVVPVLVGYGQAARYLTLRRSDESLRSQLLTFALAPAATLWAFFILRALRWWAMCTPFKTGWGTRTAGVEITLAPEPAA